jgi:hypothetical protein
MAVMGSGAPAHARSLEGTLVMGTLVVGTFLKIKINGIEFSAGRILEKNKVICFLTDTARQIHLSAGKQKLPSGTVV